MSGHCADCGNTACICDALPTHNIAPTGPAWPRSLWFFVPSTPAGQGSKRHIGHGRMIEQSKKVGPFRTAVKAEAVKVTGQIGWSPTEHPVELTTHFLIKRPKRPSRPWPPTPDVDKCLRAVCDALTGVVYVDDKQVVRGSYSKEYSLAPGVWIGVQLLPEPQLPGAVRPLPPT